MSCGSTRPFFQTPGFLALFISLVSMGGCARKIAAAHSDTTILSEYKGISVISGPRTRKLLPDDAEKLIISAAGIKKTCIEEIVEEHWRMAVSARRTGQSAPNFTNCNIAGGLAFIEEQYSVMISAAEARNLRMARQAFARILFATQSFYTNTSFIESQSRSAGQISELFLWRPEGREKVRALLNAGELFSGHDPNTLEGLERSMCSADGPAHRRLAKVRPDRPPGSDRLPHFSNFTKYQVARDLALAESRAFFEAVAERYPEVLDTCTEDRWFVPSLLSKNSSLLLGM